MAASGAGASGGGEEPGGGRSNKRSMGTRASNEEETKNKPKLVSAPASSSGLGACSRSWILRGCSRSTPKVTRGAAEGAGQAERGGESVGAEAQSQRRLIPSLTTVGDRVGEPVGPEELPISTWGRLLSGQQPFIDLTFAPRPLSHSPPTPVKGRALSMSGFCFSMFRVQARKPVSYLQFKYLGAHPPI